MNLFAEDYYKITKPIRLIELFAGIGSQAMALRDIGANFENYKVVEFDNYAINSYNAIHNTNFKATDITKISGDDLGIVDAHKYNYIMTYSFPCQDLSIAGKQSGMKKDSGTRSGLLWEVERLLNECDELPQVLLMENVPQVHSNVNKKDFFDWIYFLDSKGYMSYFNDLNAKDYGIPQNRERCFMISLLGNYDYTFPDKIELNKTIFNYLEKNVDDKYYLSDKMFNYVLDLNEKNKGTTWEGRVNNDLINPKIAHTISVSAAGGSQRAGVSNFILENYNLNLKISDLKKEIKSKNIKLPIRKLTPKECWRLMGFTDEDFEAAARVNSNTQLYKQASNSIVKNVLMAIFKQLF